MRQVLAKILDGAVQSQYLKSLTETASQSTFKLNFDLQSRHSCNQIRGFIFENCRRAIN